MKNYLRTTVAAMILAAICSCTEKAPAEDTGTEEPPKQEKPGIEEPVPETTVFSEAEFIYRGDDIGEATSDGWLIKMYTDMEIDEAGAPIGPGCVIQLLLNAPYDADQGANPEFLEGTYREMMNSGNFAPGTFVPGYTDTFDLPGQVLQIADATFYADVEDGSTEMDYDLLDEGAVSITLNEDGTCTIEGILVGKKYTKRYFSWTGNVEPKNDAPQEIPNSTLKSDIKDPVFTKGWIVDKGDSFYRMDESYRCFVLYLAEDGAEMPFDRPTGNSAVLRIDMLVPWETAPSDGIPAGTYRIVNRNADTSIDKDKIVPGVFVEGLANVFEAWKVSGTWYYELKDGIWTDRYARIIGGSVTVERGGDGSHTISYDLQDCQMAPKKISGTTVITSMGI